jgi:glycosyltransferase involved in cell wall biosynthesis
MSAAARTLPADRPLRVLQSFREPRPTTNPYIVMLRRSLDALPEARVHTFTWRRALTGGYDVFHVHWPEIMLTASTPARKRMRQALVVLLLLRLRLTRTPVVRTLHNLQPHERGSRVDTALLRRLERSARVCIRLQDQTPAPPGTAAVTVPHGHYRDWFAGHLVPGREPGRIAFVGLVRPYKNVAALLTAFRGTAERLPHARLQVAGNPTDAGLADELRVAAGNDPRITLTLSFLDDDELVNAVGRAELVALPYREMHNSGAALLALSLGRPVLVPANAANQQLAAEVGAAWVHMYEGDLTAETLLAALERAARLRPGDRPDLSARDWDLAGMRHLEAYRLAFGSG